MNTTARFYLHVPTPADLDGIESQILALGGMGFTTYMAESGRHVDDERVDETVIVYVFDVEDGYTAGPEVQKIARHVASLNKDCYMAWTPINGCLVSA